MMPTEALISIYLMELHHNLDEHERERSVLIYNMEPSVVSEKTAPL